MFKKKMTFFKIRKAQPKNKNAFFVKLGISIKKLMNNCGSYKFYVIVFFFFFSEFLVLSY